MKLKIANPGFKSVRGVDIPSAVKAGPFFVHKKLQGLGDDGAEQFGKSWTVTTKAGGALGHGAYRTARDAKAAALAMAEFVVDEHGETLGAIFGAGAGLAHDAARRFMSLYAPARRV